MKKNLILIWLLFAAPAFAAQYDYEIVDQPIKFSLDREWNPFLEAVATQNSGATDPGVNKIYPSAFTGAGLNDAVSGGTFTGSDDEFYEVIIDGTGSPDTFKYRRYCVDNETCAYTTGNAITGSAQALNDGVTITFGATTGHTLNDRWTIFAHKGRTYSYMFWADETGGLFKQRNAANIGWINLWNLATGKPSALSELPNVKHNLTATTDPGSTDDATASYSIGSRWFNVTADKEFVALDITASAAVWKETTGAGVADHGALTGLADDDHTQYHTDARGDARYFQQSEFLNSSAGAGDAGKPVKLDAGGQIDATMVNDGDIDHTQITNIGTNTHAQIDSHLGNTSNPHSVTKAQVGLTNVPDLKQNLTATTDPGATDDTNAGYSVGSTWYNVTLDKGFVCLDATATAAVWKETTEVNPTASEIKTAYESNANTNAFTDAEQTKLTGIEALADVTDATNVAAAGAVMDSDISAGEGFLRKTGAGAYEAIKSNLGATTDPGATDDTNAGYSVGSTWYNVTLDKGFVCLDATATAAVWKETTEVNPTAGEIKTAYESNANTNAFTDAEQTKLTGIETGAQVNPVTMNQAEAEALTPGTVDRIVTATRLHQSSKKYIENKDLTPIGTWNFGGGVLEIPNSITLPATCAVGEVYFDSDATAGQNTYGCTALNTWTLQGDGAGGGSGSMTTAKESDVQVGGATITTLDFGAGFDLVESPANEINITIDLTEKQVNLGTEVTGTLPDANVADALTIAGGSIATSSITLEERGAADPVIDGRAEWDTTTETFKIGDDGVATYEFFPGAHTTDHGGLGGLADDDHTQYHTDARGDARYFQKSEFLTTSAGAGDAGKPVKLDAGGQIDATMVNDGDIDHTQITNIGTNTHAQIDSHLGSTSNPHSVTKAQVGLTNVPDLKQNLTATTDPGATDDTNAGYSVGSTWYNVTLDKGFVCLDATATAAVWKETTEVNPTAGEIKTAYESNANTNAFTDAEQTKLTGIETGATADQTGAEIKTLYEAEANTNAFTDAEQSKLAGIEALADVTDATNVAAAGAVMDSDISAGEGFLRKTGAGAYEAIKSNLGATTDPGTGNDNTQGYGISSKWVNVTLDKVFEAVDVSTGAAVWKELSAAGGSGDQVSVDSGATVDPDFQDGGDINFTNTSNVVTATIQSDKVTEAMLKAVDAAADEECLTYEATVGDFEWQACGGGGATDTTQRFPIQLRIPQTSSLQGNAFWASTALTAYDWGHWEFIKDVQGIISGAVPIPKSLCSTPAAKVILQTAANATTGVTSLQVSTVAIADGESLNPASLTAETRQDITVPATAYLRKEVSFTLTNVPVADDLLVVEILHDGTQAADTLAVNTLLDSAQLEICVNN